MPDPDELIKARAQSGALRRPLGEPVRYGTVDDTTWPIDVGRLGWLLRYNPGAMTREDQLVAASVISAYYYLADPGISQTAAINALKRMRRAGNNVQHWLGGEPVDDPDA